MSRTKDILLAQPTTAAPIAVSESEAARMLGVSPRTLYTWRQNHLSPPYRKVNGRVLYSIDGLHQWLADRPDAS